ncbi:acyl-CoA dehydrogenase [Rhodococcus sp. IEGM 1381]|uniref:acyl-CoA dehydrogenase family protein n=1 Tax=Rhodococcus sp. IEGM 1381 TaxID=3047085 RepID=UPI0024B7A291|nr:acyl-CoA dehydrogenase [Rhodococcus sp. IEGM 1381]MDI9894475.1 acyl-CoA dehydrogenase [Rhodococcus sp. IEGM 1381]
MNRAACAAESLNSASPELRAEFDHVLNRGDNSADSDVFGAAVNRALDDADGFPDDACAELDGANIFDWYVPTRLGGRMHDAAQLWQLVRMLAARDLTVALAHVKTYLGAVGVWAMATPAQQRALADRVRAGAVVSLALTERDHGSDLLSGEVRAERNSSGYCINGEKWLINNASRADIWCVLARTRAEGGGRGFTLFLVDRDAVSGGRVEPLPRIPTLGMRAADISGVRFVDVQVCADAVIGEIGRGLEGVLGGFQITRSLCSGLSAGAAEHALRICVDFTRSHRLYGKPLIELPHAARQLSRGYVDLLIVETVALFSTRSASTLPQEQAIVSAVMKYFAPTTVDSMIANLGKLLGARALLDEDFADGTYAKLERDHRVVAIFDGNTAVNASALINHFPALVRGYRAQRGDSAAVRCAADLTAPIPPLDLEQLRLYARGGASVVQTTPARVADLSGRPDVPVEVRDLGLELVGELDTLHENLASVPSSANRVPQTSFDLAAKYAVAYCAAACLAVWVHTFTGGEKQDPAWLTASLTRLLRRLRGTPDYTDADGPALDAVLPHLLRQIDDEVPLSIFGQVVVE